MFADFDGERFGPERVVASGRFFANWADTPGVVAVPGSNTRLAHWLQRSGQGTYAYDIMVAVSNDNGVTWSTPFRPHDDGTPTEHGFVSYFDAGGGRIGMAWLDGRETLPAPADRHDGHAHHGHGGPMTLRTAQIDGSGTVDAEALLDTRVCDCCGTASAMTDEGPIVVYRDRSESEIRDIAIVRHGDDGWSEPALVHADGWRITGCPVNGPAVLARGQEVVVAWFTHGHDDTGRIRHARSGDGGRSFTAPGELDTGEALGRVDLAWHGEGFVLSWLSEANDGELRLARFDGEGRLVERHELLPLSGGRSSGFPRVLSLGDRRLLIAWTDVHPESGDPQVRARLLSFD